MGISRIAKKSVGDEVFEQLKASIIDGIWKPGHKIPSEKELVELLGISRVTVRDAIQRLIGMGVLSVKRGDGTYVNEVVPSQYIGSLFPLLVIDRPGYFDVQEYRLMIEPRIAQIAAAKATDNDIRQLKQSIENLKRQSGNSKNFGKEDMNFHYLLTVCTGNTLLIKINRLIGDVMESVMLEAIIAHSYDGGIKYHTKILKCIEKHDSVEAGQVMYEHIKSNFKTYKETGGRFPGQTKEEIESYERFFDIIKP